MEGARRAVSEALNSVPIVFPTACKVKGGGALISRTDGFNGYPPFRNECNHVLRFSACHANAQVYSNVTGKPYKTAEEIRQRLAEQLVAGVHV